MSSQRRTIIGAIDYSLETLKILKQDLQDISAVNKELNWAIGGIISALNKNLLQICNDVIQESAMGGDLNYARDLTEIKTRFSDFIDLMVNHE